MSDERKPPRSGGNYLFPAVADLLILILYIWKTFLKEQRTPGTLVFFIIAMILVADLVLWRCFFADNKKKSDDILGGNDHER